MKILSALLVVFFILVCFHVSAQSSNFVFTGKEMYESFTHALKNLIGLESMTITDLGYVPDILPAS